MIKCVFQIPYTHLKIDLYKNWSKNHKVKLARAVYGRICPLEKWQREPG